MILISSTCSDNGLVQTEPPGVNTRVQAKLDNHEERLDQLSGQMQDLTLMVVSMKEVIDRILVNQEKATGKKSPTEDDLDSGFVDPSVPVITESGPSASNFKPSPIREHHFDTSLFSLPKVKLPPFDGVDPRGWITKAELFFHVNNIPVTQKLRLAQMCMDGVTLNWYTNLLVKHPHSDWNQFREKLMVCFSGTKFRNPHEALGSLFDEGNIDEYIEEFEALSALISDQSEEQSIGMFL